MVQVIFTSFSLLLTILLGVSAEQCGRQAGGALCPGGQCCSQSGWCGREDSYCGKDCQSQCSGGGVGVGEGISDLIPKGIFESMLKHRNDDACPAKGFYTYEDFLATALAAPEFATFGSTETRKREIAAFLAQTSHQTTGGWESAPDGPYAWGYCHSREQNPKSSYCAPSATYPCAPGKQYFGRGPMQLTWNYNYGPCGEGIGEDLLNDPDLLTDDPRVSFRSAMWFWIIPQSPTKPSCHEVMAGRWLPSDADTAAGRKPGYGVITNIINGGNECGKGKNALGEDRIGFYKRYCDMLGVSYGDNLDCYSQRPFENELLDLVDSM